MLYTFGIKDFIDIVMVALLLYGAYRIMKTSGAANIFVGILTFIILAIGSLLTYRRSKSYREEGGF